MKRKVGLTAIDGKLYLGKVVPFTAMGLLIVHCLRDLFRGCPEEYDIFGFALTKEVYHWSCRRRVRGRRAVGLQGRSRDAAGGRDDFPRRGAALLHHDKSIKRFPKTSLLVIHPRGTLIR